MKKHLSLLLLFVVSSSNMLSFTPEEKAFLHKIRRSRIETFAKMGVGAFAGAYAAYKFPNLVNPKIKKVDDSALNLLHTTNDYFDQAVKPSYWEQCKLHAQLLFNLSNLKEILNRPLPPSEFDDLVQRRTESSENQKSEEQQTEE